MKGNENMKKFNKKFEGFLYRLIGIAIMLIAITIEGEWNCSYLVFLGINTLIIIVSLLLIKKYGDNNEF